MITEHDLQEAIAECEGQRNPSANTCIKLAAFYTIKDKMYPEKKDEVEQEIPHYSYAGQKSQDPKTEFMQAISGMSTDKFLPVIDELMSTLQVVIPRLYNGVMKRLTE